MPLPLPGDPTGAPDRKTENLQRLWDCIIADSTRDGDGDGDCEIMIRKNTFEAHRDQEEGVLLVQRLPHEVRPRSDTGVRYSISGDHTLDLKLVVPMQRPEYELKSFQLLEQGYKLCLACRGCLNYYCRYVELSVEIVRSSPPKEDWKQSLPPNVVIHHFNLCSLLASSRTECYICLMVFRELWEQYPSAIKHLPNMERFQTEICWERNVEPEERSRLYFVLVQRSKPKGLANNASLFEMDLWPINKFRHNFIPLKGTEYEDSENMAMKKSESTASPRTKALAIWWLSQCKANEEGKHAECKPSRSDYLPTRLLDVGKSQELGVGMLQLVSPEIQPQLFAKDRDYITLSHCWGDLGSRNNPLLLEDNFEERQRSGIQIKTLPKTFQDAIQIAGWHKVRWLWIDSLCIKQDSIEDWSREASLMSEIYANALLNISADSGADSDAGCFVNRTRLDVNTMAFRANNIHMSWYLTPKPRHFFRWMETAPSFSRAWIHRERQLARRILHFTQKEVVWECCGTDGRGFASETFPGGAPFKQTFNLENKYQIGRLLQTLASDDDETYEVWNDVCESLSTKKLTKLTDMPIILSSLAKDFAQKLPSDEYVAGLWQSSLPQSLLWHTRRQEKPSHDKNYFAPSWSWLSVSCPVKLVDRAQLKSSHPLVRIEEKAMAFQQDAPFGALSSASMVLSGVLRRVRVSLKGNTHRQSELSVFDDDDGNEIGHTKGSGGNDNAEDLSGTDDSRLRSIGPCYDDYEGDLYEIKLDDSPYLRFGHMQLDFFSLFVTIEQWFTGSKTNRDIECLLLEPTVEDGCSFRRVGMLKLNDLYALKMRYRFRNPPPSSPNHDIDQNKVWPSLATDIREVQDLAYQQAEEKTEKAKASHQIAIKKQEGEVKKEDTNSCIDETTESTQKEGIAALYQFDTALDSLPVDFIERLTLQTLIIV